jgi:hypothetical protein
VGKIWSEFADIGSPFRSKATDHPLTYYGFHDNNSNGTYDAGDDDMNAPFPSGSCTATTAEELSEEGNGQCHSWAHFFWRTLQLQGLQLGVDVWAIAVDEKPPYVMFAIRDWQTNPPPPASGPWVIADWDAGVDGATPYTPGLGEAADGVGVRGQGNSPNPPAAFGNHWIVKVETQYYDPSYGLGPYTDPKDYEDDAFSGGVEYQSGVGYVLHSLPANNGSADPSDEICTYSPTTTTF